MAEIGEAGNKEQESRLGAAWEWKVALGAAIVVSVALLGSYSVQTKNPLSAFGGSGLIAVGAMMAGAIVGLLFGLPRSPKPKATQSGSTASLSAKASKKSDGPRYLPNSNLDDMSDWLTKILVGVGLTQIGSIPTQFQHLVDYGQSVLGDVPGAGPVIAALLVAYLAIGFFGAYLWTRTRLGAAFAQADAEQLQEQINSNKEEIKDTKERTVKIGAVTEQVARRQSEGIDQVEISTNPPTGAGEPLDEAALDDVLDELTKSDRHPMPDTTAAAMLDASRPSEIVRTRRSPGHARAVIVQPTREQLEREFLSVWDRLLDNEAFAKLDPESIRSYPQFSTRTVADLPGAKRWLNRNGPELHDLRVSAQMIASGPDAMTTSDPELRGLLEKAAQLEDAYASEVAADPPQ